MKMQLIQLEDHKEHNHHVAGQLLVCYTCGIHGIMDIESKRKPFNRDAGYIASKRSGKDGGWIVIYNAAEQGFDAEGGKYAVTCQTHHTVVNTTSLPKAREIMKHPDFCQYCTGEEP